MRLLSWNCRELGNPRTVRDLSLLVKIHKPSILFLMETKLHMKNLEAFKLKLGFQCVFSVEGVGRSGGMILLWADELGNRMIGQGNLLSFADMKTVGLYLQIVKKLSIMLGKVQQLRELQTEIDNQLEREHVEWKQRAKENWLPKGDRNTKFYHLSATQKKKRNNISKIVDDTGKTISDQKQIGESFTQFFKGLFATSNPKQMEDVINTVKRKVTPQMNEALIAPFRKEEVEEAVFQMGPYKSPGPDGYGACFYQKYWSVIGEDVSDAILDFMHSDHGMEDINFTYLVMIPKCSNPVNITDFRPISLCNVLYKIITKMLANRLKQILPFIISQNQCAFVPGRLISDNILAAYETLHVMRTKMKERKGYMALKLDMSKAYDRIEWNFLKEVMVKMGFDVKWIELILRPAPNSRTERADLRGSNCKRTDEAEPLVSGQRPNRNKTSLYFSNNIRQETKHYILQVAGLRAASNMEKYLGLPSVIERSKVTSFQGIVKKCVENLRIGRLSSSHKLAKVGSRPSYTWKSISSAINIVKEGMIWRITNGEDVKIWQDKWIPTNNSGKVMSPVKILSSNAKVTELIDPNTRWWNMQLLHDIFWIEDRQQIIRIPVAQTTHLRDNIAWKYTSNGCFTVKSAYQLCKQRQDQDKGETSTIGQNKVLWKHIWQMQTKNAVKVFIWRACNNALPTKQNLYKRKIVEEPLCPICQQTEETLGHVLWACSSAQDAWMLGSRKMQKATITHDEFGDIFMDMLQRIGKDEICVFAELARMLWLRRNKLLFEDYFVAPSILMQKAKQACTEFQQLQHKQCSPRSHGNEDQIANDLWYPPDQIGSR
ncbi:uncharacterized protein LOC121264998 [Juglans microcarpa x Juglans regia]|uniref:uncharacterized protein LOC121264998 n=1 Tax=Juglans microcarpa x Juglans regia TaxID=2249226 RepID=UPI001B7EF555|nr:uncharacterized protein LOC121264998 [Juglans microcarpa x Juglans regia]